MQESLSLFKTVTRSDEYKSTPVVALLNKLDLFREVIRETLIFEHFPEHGGGMSCYEGCKFFADLFDKRDIRPKALLRIHPTSAMVTRSFQRTSQGIRDLVEQLRPETKPLNRFLDLLYYETLHQNGLLWSRPG